jgi:hypothetical protein
METIRLWTKQHKGVWRSLSQKGRYTVEKRHIIQANEDMAGIFLAVYDWYTGKAERLVPRPGDARYPVWCSLSAEAALLPDDISDSLELEAPKELVIPVNLNKWSTILNYFYIPADEADGEAHSALLRRYNTNDAVAFMTPFYPQIKREIVASWDRLFEGGDDGQNAYVYGTLWELRREWIRSVNGRAV